MQTEAKDETLFHSRAAAQIDESRMSHYNFTSVKAKSSGKPVRSNAKSKALGSPPKGPPGYLEQRLEQSSAPWKTSFLAKNHEQILESLSKSRGE